MKRTITVIAAGAALALGLTACGSGSSSEGSGAAAGDIKLGMSVSTLNNPYFVQLRKGAEDEAKKQGVALTVTDAQNDASQQVNQIQNFASQSMKAIIINPVDSDAAGPAVKAAERSKIPVIAVDRVVNGATVAQTVASDNVAGGKLAAQELAKQMGEKGKVAVLQGVPGTSASRDRGQGFTEGIKAYPDIQVVAQQPADFDRTKGLDVMTNLVQSNPGITGVFAENDEMALGAIKALGAKAGKEVKIVGFDGTPDGLKAIEAGTLNASIAQQPQLLGQQAVQGAVKAAKGEKIEATVAVPVKAVNKDNVAEFAGS
ncbi:D-ribose ABC transporter substrate-binding protein [Streptosporangium roseum]|uniref:Ribose ABC transporter, substrate binding protein n=1 Tax=Streptosporangium roseum (strain ATCC 12428 / DSM 43021 / JCM 3005 / KCTC 9067 / NCIMB 10171 / NRRL 2505 / NI 9100) TaxID=479432 RepID=D2BEN3_STRRD|nr:D-ribose ABC transporter substrate-binding protein [Streptosporangium roseum]ACZ84396.1 ribose ABC transporter, substrate binding protein [Streptosporangium roseum DSM 43021]